MKPTTFHTLGGKGAAPRERGAALVMSLVILVILTLLGITALSTSTLEERMAGSMQEATLAFEAAESGISSALATPGVLNLNAQTTNDFNYDDGRSGSTRVVASFIQYSPPKRGSGYSAQYRVANFDLQSQGTTTANAQATISQGVGQVMPKQ